MNEEEAKLERQRQSVRRSGSVKRHAASDSTATTSKRASYQPSMAQQAEDVSWEEVPEDDATKGPAATAVESVAQSEPEPEAQQAAEPAKEEPAGPNLRLASQ